MHPLINASCVLETNDTSVRLELSVCRLKVLIGENINSLPFCFFLTRKGEMSQCEGLVVRVHRF